MDDSHVVLIFCNTVYSSRNAPHTTTFDSKSHYSSSDLIDGSDPHTILQMLLSMDVDPGLGLDTMWRAFVGEQGFGYTDDSWS